MQHKRLHGRCTKNSQWHSQTEGKDMLNRCDFTCALKVENVHNKRRSTGRLFQATWTGDGKSDSWAPRSRHQKFRTSAVDAEHSWRRESTSDSFWINSDRYCGAAACTRMQRLYWIRSGTCSQCKFTSCGVTWSNFVVTLWTCYGAL